MARHHDRVLTLPAGPCETAVVRPDDDRPTRPALLLMDAVGLRPAVVDHARRVADLGFTVLVPNLFHRAGPQPLVDAALLAPDRYDDRVARFHELFASLTDDDWDADGPLLLAAAREHSGSDAPVAVVGYCMGGRLGIRLAARNRDDVACVAAFHAGQLVTDAPGSPHRLLADVRCPVLLGHADGDASMTPDDQAEVARAAAQASCDYTGYTNPGAAHGFTMPDMPAFHPAAAERAAVETARLLARC